MNTVSLIGLCKIELPASYGDVHLCDGGFIEYDYDTYRSFDELLGTIGSMQPLSEGVGNEVPALEMVFLPPEDSTPALLVQPGWQTSRCRFWVGEYSPETGELTEAPDLVFDGQLDQASLSVGATRELAITVVSLAERLFERNSGNGLTSAWHKSIWSGELGHDNATGLNVQVAWGTANPAGSGAYTPTSPYHSPRNFREQGI